MAIEPEEDELMVAFLGPLALLSFSDEGSWITGTTWDVDGWAMAERNH